MSYGLMENVAAALRTGAVSEKGMNEFRKGGVLNLVAELVADGWIEASVLEQIVEAAMPPEVLSADQIRAKEIMGANFVSPTAFEKALRGRVSFTPADLAALATVPWTDDVLREELAHGAILFPAHPKATLPWLRDLFGTSKSSQPRFYKESTWWLGSDGDRFRDRSLPVGWHLVRTVLEPDSTSKTWDDQQKLVPDTYERTLALEAALVCTFVYQTQNKKRVLKDRWAWCSDVVASGDRVGVGFFDEGGFFVSANHPTVDWIDDLGLLLSRKVSRT